MFSVFYVIVVVVVPYIDIYIWANGQNMAGVLTSHGSDYAAAV